MPKPSELYNLKRLLDHPKAAVLIVDGKEQAKAAKKLVGDRYILTTWDEGPWFWSKTDLSPLCGRTVILWPDHPSPMHNLFWTDLIDKLKAKACKVKAINIADQDEKWGPITALAQGWDWAKFYAWAKPLIKEYVKTTSIIEEPPEQPPIEDEHPEDAEPSKSCVLLWEEMGLACTSSGAPITNIDNIVRVMSAHKPLTDSVWYDDFYRTVFLNRSSANGKPRELEDGDILRITTYVQNALGISRMPDEAVHKGITVYAQSRTRNAPRDWMDSLSWDHVGRIDRFFIDYLGATDDLYTMAVGTNFWLGMVARIYRPGCQVDNMVVLEGAQGKRKSSALRAIGHEWFSEMTESVSSKDFLQALSGTMLVEIAELDSFSKAESSRIKQVISSRVDRYRSSYGRMTKNHPRQCVFVGSTNEGTYLKDATGGRRFWPIKCGFINVEKIEDERAQLFAEAVYRLKAGEKWWEMPEGTTEDQQEKRRQSDLWEDVVSEYLHGRDSTTSKEIAIDVLKIELAKIDVGAQRRIGSILRRLDWEVSNEKKDGKVLKIWRRNGCGAPK